MSNFGIIVEIKDKSAWGEFDKGGTFDIPSMFVIDDVIFKVKINNQISFSKAELDGVEYDSVLIIQENIALLLYCEKRSEGIEIIAGHIIRKDNTIH